MFNKVLVPVDMAELELAAGILPYVSRLSRDLGLPVVLLSTLNPDNVEIPGELETRPGETQGQIPPGSEGILMGAPSTGPIPVPGTEESSRQSHETITPNAVQVIENARTEVRRQLNRFVSRLAEEGIDVSCEVTVGTEPAEEILKFAEEQKCDLIAMATHDRNLLGQAMEGSVTNEVVRSASVPVMAITPEKSDVVPEQKVTVSRIIVPLDGSPFSEAVLPYVEYLAQKMPLEVVLARMISSTDVYPAGAGGITPVADTGIETTQMYQIAEEDAVEYLKSIAARLDSAGIKVRWELLRGAPSPNVADLAEEISHSMIALSSHGRSGIMRWVLGSVAEDLIRATGEPVLVIPPQVAEKSQT